MGSPSPDPGPPSGWPSLLARSDESIRRLAARWMAPGLGVILGAIVGAQLLVLLAGALGWSWFQALGPVLQPLLTVILVFITWHWCCLRPLAGLVDEADAKIQRLRSSRHRLEQALIACDTELSTARARLQSEEALRRRRDAEVVVLKTARDQCASELAAQAHDQNRLLQQVTELARLAATARQDEKRFRSALEMFGEGVWTLGPDGRTLFINRRGATLLGCPALEIVGQPPAPFLHLEDFPQEVRTFDLRQGSSPDPVSCRVRRKDGRPLVVRASLCSIMDEEGEYLGALILFHEAAHPVPGPIDPPGGRWPQDEPGDEADREQEQRLASAKRLAGGLARELSAPFGAVLLSAQVLRSRLPREDRDLLDTIQSSTERSAELLKQALLFAGELHSEHAEVRPGVLLKEIVEVLRGIFPRNIQVNFDISPGLWSIQAEASLIKQVLLKLCANARSAMPEGGQFEIRAANLEWDGSSPAPAPGLVAGRYLVVEFHDSGPPIPPGIQDRIFEPFFPCAERATLPGLGLAAVEAIVRSHGGRVTARSMPPGACFAVYLPAHPGPAEDRERPPLELTPGRGELILLVETDAAQRQAAEKILRGHGYRVLPASDGAEALGLLAENPGRVQVILTNIVMTPMDGPALARAARQMDPVVRLIATTAAGSRLAQRDKLAALQSLGISRLLPKPYGARELLEVVRDALAAPAPPLP